METATEFALLSQESVTVTLTTLLVMETTTETVISTSATVTT
jgi:hypothetical protein